MYINWSFPLFQYYEMSYGLNIEMHKQVSQLQDFSLSAFPVPPPSLCPEALHYSLVLSLPLCFALNQLKKYELFLGKSPLFFSVSLPLLCQFSLWWTCRAVFCCGGVNRIHKQNSFLHHRQMRIVCPSLLPVINPSLLFPPSVLSILSLSLCFSIPSSFFYPFPSIYVLLYLFNAPPLLISISSPSLSLFLLIDFFLFISYFFVHPASTSVSLQTYSPCWISL